MAAGRGSVESSRVLLEAGANIKEEDKDGMGALHHLFRCEGEGVLATYHLLVENGADINKADIIGLSPLHALLRSIPKGALEMLKLLLDRGSDLSMVDSTGLGPLHILFQSSPDGVLEMFKLLLDKGANAHSITESGWNVLDFAVFLVTDHEALLEITKTLIKLGASTNHNDGKESTTLILAIRSPHTSNDILKVLIEAGADVNGRDGTGSTVLHEAVSKDRLEAVEILLKHQARVKARNRHSNSAFHEASFKGNVPIISALAKALPDHYSYYDEEGDNTFASGILFQTSEATALASIENGGLLIPRTEPVETSSELSESQSTEAIFAMQKAAYLGNEEEAKRLIAGFVRLGDIRALSCGLHAAVGGNSLELTRYLLDNGADIESKVGNNRTPLHMAAMGGFHDLTKFLLDRGADSRAKDVVGTSPLELGIRPERSHIDFVTLMINHDGIADSAEICTDRHQQAALTGVWDGTFIATNEEGMGNTVRFWWDIASLKSSSPWFCGCLKNSVSKWSLLGQLLSDGTVYFVAFVDGDSGYVYIGKLDMREMTITGAYGLNSQILTAGTFTVKPAVAGSKKAKEDDTTQAIEEAQKLDEGGDNVEKASLSDEIKESDGTRAENAANRE